MHHNYCNRCTIILGLAGYINFGAGTTPNHIEIGFRFPIDNNFIEAMAMMAALGICTYVTVNPNAFCRQADRGSLSETDDVSTSVTVQRRRISWLSLRNLYCSITDHVTESSNLQKKWA